MGKNSKILKTLEYPRRKTRPVKIGRVYIGGDFPIAIQAMTKTKTADIKKTLKEIKDLEIAGAEIIRLAVKDKLDAQAIKSIKKYTETPLVADIHFDYRLAIMAIENGIDKIRLNPGNIRDKNKIREIVKIAKERHIPIRVGLNSGSIGGLKPNFDHKDIVKLMIKEALNYLKILEGFGFNDIVVSLKTSDIKTTIQAYEKMAKLCDYPFHLGLTATGSPLWGIISSSIVLGTLLKEGIGDTIRVSLTDSAVQEVKVAKYILAVLGLRNFGYQIISCPTCGRCEVNLMEIVEGLENRISSLNYKISATPIKLAVMGCVVNGPGEAKDADIGIACGKGKAAIVVELSL
ncbi:MAG: flavodoxin-dependent (E)-4-hydroxy-3-methylbut-2-enyl-diphosphate synthase, partial [Candidatus Omnitrophica bacterium]|nr:flavodoxin-dependent (E)-4-hydroxy-3-methylbut-2-enyl-diphosphate synthase [Candidatus Omnitrophota bacterium]